MSSKVQVSHIHHHLSRVISKVIVSHGDIIRRRTGEQKVFLIVPSFTPESSTILNAKIKFLKLIEVRSFIQP